MSCGEFVETNIPIEPKILDENINNKCIFLNLCYFSIEDKHPFNCKESINKFAIIEYDDIFLNFFPKDYNESDIIGKIYGFEIKFDQIVYHPGILYQSHKYNNIVFTCYFMFIDHYDDYKEKRKQFECFKNWKDSTGKILDMTEIKPKLFGERCTKTSENKITINKIDYFSKKIYQELMSRGLLPLVQKKEKTTKQKQEKIRKEKHSKRKFRIQRQRQYNLHNYIVYSYIIYYIEI